MEFEEAAEKVLAWCHDNGFPDAALTEDAGSGAWDVEAAEMIAEINIAAPPSRPNVQRLDQVARSAAKRALYFSVRGFTISAKEWANNVDIALLAFTEDGEGIEPGNEIAAEFERPAEPESSQEDRLLNAVSRAVASLQQEVEEDRILAGADEETRDRIVKAKEAKNLRRNLFN